MNDPAGFAPDITVHSEVREWGEFHGDHVTPLDDARLIAEAILELCDRAEGQR